MENNIQSVHSIIIETMGSVMNTLLGIFSIRVEDDMESVDCIRVLAGFDKDMRDGEMGLRAIGLYRSSDQDMDNTLAGIGKELLGPLFEDVIIPGSVLLITGSLQLNQKMDYLASLMKEAGNGSIDGFEVESRLVPKTRSVSVKIIVPGRPDVTCSVSLGEADGISTEGK